MEKIGRFYREASQRLIKDNIAKSSGMFLLRYSGVSSAKMVELRASIKDVSSRILVAKNSLLHRALKSANISGLDEFVKGPTAVVFSQEDISAVAKVIINFTKENPALSVLAAFYNNSVIGKEKIQEISKLPSKEALRAYVVMALKSPLTNLVFTLQGNLNKLIIVLNQIKTRKEIHTDIRE